MKTITAKIPARKIGNFSFPAHEATYTMDDAGKWSGKHGAMLEMDVIEDCKRASNWAAIRAEHFPMAGFHS